MYNIAAWTPLSTFPNVLVGGDEKFLHEKGWKKWRVPFEMKGGRGGGRKKFSLVSGLFNNIL